MPLALADVLVHPVFRRSKPRLLAGAAHLDRPIRWVHSTDVYEAAALLRGGELLLTTGLGLSGADERLRREFLRTLAGVGVSGVALELGWTYSEVPDDMIDEAERAGLPLIALHHLVPFVEVTEALNAIIVNDSIVGLRYADALSSAMSDALAHGATLEQLLDRLSQHVNLPAMLVDPDGSTIARAVTKGVESQSVEAMGAISAEVSVDGVPIATLSVGDPGPSTRAVVQGALSRACPALALELLRSRSPVGTQVQATRQLFERLTVGDISPHAIAPLASAAGLPVEDAQYVAVATSERLGRAAEALRESFRSLGLAHAVTGWGSAAVGLVASGRSPVRPALDVQVARSLRATLPVTRDPVVAVGPVVNRLGDTARSLSEARTCLSIGADVLGGLGSISMASLLVADRLLRGLSSEALDWMIVEMLEGLVTLPAARREELITTLEIYLSTGGAKAATARLLTIQRQTLYQRLERITGLLGRDIDDPNVSMGLALALRAWRIRNPIARRPAAPDNRTR